MVELLTYFLKVSETSRTIVVVSHASFIRHFLAYTRACPPAERSLTNCECRHVSLSKSFIQDCIARYREDEERVKAFPLSGCEVDGGNVFVVAKGSLGSLLIHPGVKPADVTIILADDKVEGGTRLSSAFIRP